MLQTARHEGFHQYLDRIVPNAPIWFNEGLAVYYENARVVRGKWVDGNLHANYLARVKSRLVPLEEFLKMRQPAFMKDAAQHYGQAWAFIHFLRHSKYGRKTKLFDRFWKAFQAHPSYPRALKQALGETSINEVETRFAAYVTRLKG